MSQRLEGKVALVTGAASGIGKAIAARFEAAGATVITSDRTAGCTLALDVASEAQWNAAFEYISARHGRLDILVNAAGVSIQQPLMATSLSDFRQLCAINVEGAFLGCQRAAALMRQMATPARGVILNISSIAADLALPEYGAYGVSKAALTNLTRALAVEFGRKGDFIRLVAIHPGGTRTGMTEAMMPVDAWDAPGSWDHVPMRTYGRAEDVAETALYAASEDARFVTGVALVVDGGWSKGAGW